MPAAANIKEHVANFAMTVDRLEKKQAETGIKLLWGTANLFSHPRYMGGASTNPDPDVWAFAATQVRHCMDATKRLGGANYVLWGGREGYDTLLNTSLKHELANFGRFLQLVVEHKHKIGFKGTILIEPKPHEPTKHQYDFDTATVYGFLKKNGLENEVKVNIEANHATLAGHSFDHEIAMADALGIFGSIDINRGDPQNGWDTDQFHNDPLDMTLAMYRILKAGGFTTGGFNFDAKVRRQTIDPADMFYGHVGGLDLLARTLLSAAALIENGGIDKFVEQRYAKWAGEAGQEDPRQGRIAGVDLRCGGGGEHQSEAAVGSPGIPGEPGQPLRLNACSPVGGRVATGLLGGLLAISLPRDLHLQWSSCGSPHWRRVHFAASQVHRKTAAYRAVAAVLRVAVRGPVASYDARLGLPRMTERAARSAYSAARVGQCRWPRSICTSDARDHDCPGFHGARARRGRCHSDNLFHGLIDLLRGVTRHVHRRLYLRQGH